MKTLTSNLPSVLKSETGGGSCKVGQRSDLTGCVPADGTASATAKKTRISPTETPKDDMRGWAEDWVGNIEGEKEFFDDVTGNAGFDLTDLDAFEDTSSFEGVAETFTDSIDDALTNMTQLFENEMPDVEETEFLKDSYNEIKEQKAKFAELAQKAEAYLKDSHEMLDAMQSRMEYLEENPPENPGFDDSDFREEPQEPEEPDWPEEPESPGFYHHSEDELAELEDKDEYFRDYMEDGSSHEEAQEAWDEYVQEFEEDTKNWHEYREKYNAWEKEYNRLDEEYADAQEKYEEEHPQWEKDYEAAEDEHEQYWQKREEQHEAKIDALDQKIQDFKDEYSEKSSDIYYAIDEVGLAISTEIEEVMNNLDGAVESIIDAHHEPEEEEEDDEE